MTVLYVLYVQACPLQTQSLSEYFQSVVEWVHGGRTHGRVHCTSCCTYFSVLLLWDTHGPNDKAELLAKTRSKLQALASSSQSLSIVHWACNLFFLRSAWSMRSRSWSWNASSRSCSCPCRSESPNWQPCRQPGRPWRASSARQRQSWRRQRRKQRRRSRHWRLVCEHSGRFRRSFLGGK